MKWRMRMGEKVDPSRAQLFLMECQNPSIVLGWDTQTASQIESLTLCRRADILCYVSDERIEMSLPPNPARDILLGQRELVLPTNYEELEQAVYTHDEKGKRVDVHRPSAINPGDYEYIKVGQSRKLVKEGMNPYSGGPAGTCHHCGKWIVWEVHYRHIPSNNHVTFGYQCAEILDMTDNRIDHEMNMLKRAAKRLREKWEQEQEQKERAERFKREEPEVYNFLTDLDEDESFYFVKDLARNLEQWGSLTERQTQAAKKIILQRRQKEKERIEREANRVVPTTPLANGRQWIGGTVEFVKTPDQNDMFPAWKMRVVMDDGNAVWGTVPRVLLDEARDNNSDVQSYLKGRQVRFMAEIKVSEKDQHFGFYRKPTQARTL